MCAYLYIVYNIQVLFERAYLYMCMCWVRLYVCTCTYIYMYTYTTLVVETWRGKNQGARTVSACFWIIISRCMYTHTHTHESTHARAHTQTHTHTHTNTHTHTHTHARELVGQGHGDDVGNRAAQYTRGAGSSASRSAAWWEQMDCCLLGWYTLPPPTLDPRYCTIHPSGTLLLPTASPHQYPTCLSHPQAADAWVVVFARYLHRGPCISVLSDFPAWREFSVLLFVLSCFAFDPPFATRCLALFASALRGIVDSLSRPAWVHQEYKANMHILASHRSSPSDCPNTGCVGGGGSHLIITAAASGDTSLPVCRVVFVPLALWAGVRCGHHDLDGLRWAYPWWFLSPTPYSPPPPLSCSPFSLLMLYICGDFFFDVNVQSRHVESKDRHMSARAHDTSQPTTAHTCLPPHALGCHTTQRGGLEERYIYICISLCIYVHVYICMYIYTYIHKYIHTW